MRKHKGAVEVAVLEKPAELSYAVIDFPQEKEIISSLEYTLRVGASQDAAKVEISIDGAEWQACRPAVGFWWYDWSNYSKLAHRASARITTHAGKVVFSDPRKFYFKLPTPPAPKKATKVSKVKGKLKKMLGDAGINI